MKKLKNEQQLTKMAIQVGENYAKNRGYQGFTSNTSVKEKVECIYRLLVKDKLVIPLPEEHEDLLNMKHRLAMWIKNKLPAGHALLQ